VRDGSRVKVDEVRKQVNAMERDDLNRLMLAALVYIATYDISD
jgi:hypothetical protein